ncbi:alkaline phosphatase family protein [Thaumasiovibrio subtropicus]|uniref:alkaline phosphatase family protein n=1 Tax=Thaumasiovibrio subtropicus TaxID=1891207 RepID=UPI000B354F7D|nr:alkaline phosphatase family protein [Thaumasiovibrio subtropicus]
MKRQFRCCVLATLVGVSLFSNPVQAEQSVRSTPVVGGIVNTTDLLHRHIFEGLTLSTKTTRDASLFTIAGLSLDAYILTLPLDAATKARVVAQLSNPNYSIPLGYFLYTFYDRYGGIEQSDAFKSHLLEKYPVSDLREWQHTLFRLATKTTLTTQPLADESHHHGGINVNREFIASLVVVYDALVEIDAWRKHDQLPNQYTYLADTPQDWALIRKIQPIVVGFLTQLESGMAPGDMRSTVSAIVADGQPERAGIVNNKAEALTITLIDFVRLNVLKSYRQFVLHEARVERLASWMAEQLDDDPLGLADYLAQQSTRPLAVQIVVDGLQQGLLEGLVSAQHPFWSAVYQDHLDGLSLQARFPEYATPKGFQLRQTLEAFANQDELHHAWLKDSRYLPFFKFLYQDYRHAIAPVGIASTPTISVRNLPIAKTGASVAGEEGTGIPNFHFVSRPEDRAYYFFGNDALALDRLLAQNRVPTMFERLDHLNTLNCNAQYDWHAHTSYDALVNLGAGEAQRDFGEMRCLRELQWRSDAEKKAQALRDKLQVAIAEYEQTSAWLFLTKSSQKQLIKEDLNQLAELSIKGMPDYTLIYNPWPDHFAHFTGPFADEIIAPTGELNRLDYWLSEVTNVYQQAGVYPQTLWGMAGDHGLAPVYVTLNPEKSVFEHLEQTYGYPIVVKKISSDEGEGPKITHALNPPSMQNIDVVVASTAGGNLMFDFFNADDGWETQPVYHELTRWRPISATNKSQAIDLIAEISQQLQDTLDYLVVRESACTSSYCEVRLVGYRGEKLHHELVTQLGDRVHYRSVSHPNESPVLLEIQQANRYLMAPTEESATENRRRIAQCMAAEQDKVTTWCHRDEWQALTRWSAKPDAINQIVALYHEERAGTVNLFPKQGVGFNTKVPGRHAGEHYLEKDAFIGFWGAPVMDAQGTLSISANGSLAPTLYEYLTGEAVKVGENYWGYPSLLNTLLESEE